jgi:hypothetical protein
MLQILEEQNHFAKNPHEEVFYLSIKFRSIFTCNSSRRSPWLGITDDEVDEIFRVEIFNLINTSWYWIALRKCCTPESVIRFSIKWSKSFKKTKKISYLINSN